MFWNPEGGRRRGGSDSSKSQVAKATCFDEAYFFEEAFEWVRGDASFPILDQADEMCLFDFARNGWSLNLTPNVTS